MNSEISKIVDELLESDEFKFRVKHNSAIIRDYVLSKTERLSKSLVNKEICRNIIVEILNVCENRKKYIAID